MFAAQESSHSSERPPETRQQRTQSENIGLPKPKAADPTVGSDEAPVEAIGEPRKEPGDGARAAGDATARTAAAAAGAPRDGDGAPPHSPAAASETEPATASAAANMMACLMTSPFRDAG